MQSRELLRNLKKAFVLASQPRVSKLPNQIKVSIFDVAPTKLNETFQDKQVQKKTNMARINNIAPDPIRAIEP